MRIDDEFFVLPWVLTNLLTIEKSNWIRITSDSI